MRSSLITLLILAIGIVSVFADRDPETGTFLTRDPAGFIDGPNVYTYVLQNPWSKFDPEGLDAAGVENGTSGDVEHDIQNDELRTEAGMAGLGGLVIAPGMKPGSVPSAVSGVKPNAATPSIPAPTTTTTTTTPLPAGTTVSVVGGTTTIVKPTATPGSQTVDQVPDLFTNRALNDPIGTPKIVPNAKLTDSNFHASNLNYIVDQNGDLVVGRQFEGAGGGHIDLANGEPVQAAGEMKVSGGQVKSMNNLSGHYQPSGPGAQSAAETAATNAGLTLKSGAYKEKTFPNTPPAPTAKPPTKIDAATGGS